MILGLIILFFEIFYNQNSAYFINNRAIAKVNDQYINEDQFLKYAITLGADFKAEEEEVNKKQTQECRTGEEHGLEGYRGNSGPKFEKERAQQGIKKPRAPFWEDDE